MPTSAEWADDAVADLEHHEPSYTAQDVLDFMGTLEAGDDRDFYVAQRDRRPIHVGCYIRPGFREFLHARRANKPPPFAKLFDTAEGQLLAYMGETDEFEPAIIVIAAAVDDVIPAAKLSGWAADDGQQKAFDMIDQAAAEDHARTLRNLARQMGGETP